MKSDEIIEELPSAKPPYSGQYAAEYMRDQMCIILNLIGGIPPMLEALRKAHVTRRDAADRIERVANHIKDNGRKAVKNVRDTRNVPGFVIEPTLARLLDNIANLPCGSCGGSGRYLNKWWDHENGILMEEYIRCTKCDGTGKHELAREAEVVRLF